MNPSATVSAVEKLAGHSIDVSLLPERPLVLDVGCRDFGFCGEILLLRPAAKILAFDPDPAIEPPADERIRFVCKAVTHSRDSMLPWNSGGEASYIGQGENSVLVPNVAMTDLIFAPRLHAKDSYDLIKLDCEGSEFGILENWPGPIAQQISVEFHDYADRDRWNDAYFEKLFAGPLKDYRIAQHELQPIGPANTLGHWDSLLIIR